MEQWLKSFIMTEMPSDPLISNMEWVTVNLGQNWCYAQYLWYTPHRSWSLRSDSIHTMPTSWRARWAPITTALPDPCVTWAISISAGGLGRGGSQDISPAQCLTGTPRTGSQRGGKGLLLWIHGLCTSAQAASFSLPATLKTECSWDVGQIPFLVRCRWRRWRWWK